MSVGEHVDVPALQQEVQDLLQFVYLMPVAVARLGPQGQVEMLNPKAVQLLEELDIDSGRVDGVQILDALCPGAADEWRARAGHVGPVMAPRRCSPVRAQRDPLHLLVQLVRVDERCSMLTLEDISTAVEQERELARQRRRLALALEQIRGYGVVMLDGAGAVIEWNPSLQRLFGLAEGAVTGHKLLDWVAAQAPGAPALPDFGAIVAAVASQGWCQLQAPWQRAGGEPLWGDCIVTPVVESHGGVSGYVAVVRDITRDREREQRLLDESLHDPLTGVANRRGLERRIELLQERPGPAEACVSWIMVDIDHFKQVNDSFGHDGGDTVLKAVAGALQAAARSGDTLARFGGEEFVLLLPSAAEAAAARAAERMRARVEAMTVTVGANTVRITASFGVAQQAPGERWTQTLERADAALYKAKHGGRNRVEVGGAEAGVSST